MRIAVFLIPLITLSAPAQADPPEVVAANIANGRVNVTLRHPDTGWEHYADGWEVLAPDGTRLGFRELLHPHVNEQPFTRSLSGVSIPEGIDHVLIRARCNVDGWSSETFKVPLAK